MKDKNGKTIYEPYRIKVLNTINFKKSMHYMAGGGVALIGMVLVPLLSGLFG